MDVVWQSTKIDEESGAHPLYHVIACVMRLEDPEILARRHDHQRRVSVWSHGGNL